MLPFFFVIKRAYDPWPHDAYQEPKKGFMLFKLYLNTYSFIS
jgi:hypothetical protein